MRDRGLEQRRQRRRTPANTSNSNTVLISRRSRDEATCWDGVQVGQQIEEASSVLRLVHGGVCVGVGVGVGEELEGV
jgi:hypothetical protein